MRREVSASRQEKQRRALMLTVGNLAVVAFTLLFRPAGLSGIATLACIALAGGLFTLSVELGLRRARRRSPGAPQP